MPLVRDVNKELSFFETMSGPDAFTVVVKGAGYIDRELTKFIEMSVLYPSVIKDLSLDYQGKCSLASALGLPIRMRAPLKAIGSVRNRLAHDPDASLTETDAKNLLNCLSPDDREVTEATLSRLQRKRGEVVVPLSRMGLLDRYVLVMITLRSGIVAAQRFLTILQDEASDPSPPVV
jgi:hypothetical protein